MYSIRPYQAYSFRCWFSNNSILAFVVSVLPQDLVSLRSFHSILNFVPEAICCCSLFFFSNGELSTSFISVVFFSRNDLTSSRFVFSLVCQWSNLVLPLLFLFHRPSGAILDLGMRSSRSGGVLWRPETDVPGVVQLFADVAMSFACVLHLAMSSCALHHHVFKTCIRPGSPGSFRCPFWA